MARSEKEALVLVLDVGISMSTPINVNSTYLQTCADMMQMIIQRKMFQSSKDDVGLVLFGTNETANDLWDGKSDHYTHINVARPLSEVDWALLEFIQKKVHTTNIETDLFDALTVAADHLHSQAEKRKYTEKRIIIFSDYSTLSEDQNVDEITDALKNDSIRLDIVSPFDELNDNDDEDEISNKKHNNRAYNDEHETKQNGSSDNRHMQKKLMTREQIKNQSLLKKIVSETDGAMYSFSEVLTLLSLYQAKSVKSAGTKYILDIGEDLKIPVVSMIKVKENKPEMFRFKKVYAKDDKIELKTDRARFTKDDEQRDLDDKTDVVNAYRYGSTYVPIDDDETLHYKVEKGFSLLGFTKSENVKRYYFLGDSVHQIIPDMSNCDEEMQRAFVSMVEAMYEDDVYGIIRKVFNARASPRMGCLIPYIDNKITCLLYIDLPFEDDVRKFTLENFSLIKKFKPNESQLNLIDNLIDNMDLENLKNDKNDDDDDEIEEAYDPKLTFNPYIQRMFQTIALRGSDSNTDLPDFDNHITTKYLKRYENIIRNDQTVNLLKRCADAFPTRVNESKKKKLDATDVFGDKKSASKPGNDNDDEANKNINIDDLYANASNNLNKVRKIGTINPVNDFNQLIQSCDMENDFNSICEQLIELIKQFLIESMHQSGGDDDLYQIKAYDCLNQLRDTCLKYDKIKFINDFFIDFKQYLFESSETKRYYEKMKIFFKNYFIEKKLTLVSSSENSLSTKSDDDVSDYLKLPIDDESNVNNKQTTDKASDENVEDLLDLM